MVQLFKCKIQEKERYTYLNAEFQRISRRDKKAFLSEQCKEIEENNRMGKTRDHFKKIRATKGIFHAKMGAIKNRNSMDLTEAEDIKKRWQEYTEKLYKKNLSVQFSHSVMSNSLRPHDLQHARPPCPSQTPGGYSNSRPSSRWLHPAISSSVIPQPPPAPNPSQHQSLFQ